MIKFHINKEIFLDTQSEFKLNFPISKKFIYILIHVGQSVITAIYNLFQLRLFSLQVPTYMNISRDIWTNLSQYELIQINTERPRRIIKQVIRVKNSKVGLLQIFKFYIILNFNYSFVTPFDLLLTELLCLYKLKHILRSLR